MKTDKYDNYYMKIAELTASNSKALRNKVGCVIVKNNNILSYGWNGTPHGFNNKCEDKDNNTLPYVIHSEINAICKLAKSTVSADGATMYITLSPCFNCALAIIQSGIKKIVYLNEYRDTRPLDILRKAKIVVIKL